MSAEVVYFEDLLIDYLKDVSAKTEKVSPDEYDDIWLELFFKTKELVKKADESYLKDSDKVRAEVMTLVDIYNDKTLTFPDLVEKALNHVIETKQSCLPDKGKVHQFKDLAQNYGFKILQDGEAYRLCAKNTDNRWTRWISYYPDKDTVSSLGNTDYLNIWLCDTRKDFTPEKCLNFVEDLNKLFELKGEDKFLIKDLVDPEDWQEIAGVRDASEDKRYFSGKNMNISIYKIDSSKLVKIGEDGYLPGQEQAKIYFDEIPNGEFVAEITDEEQIKEIAAMADVDFRGTNRLLISINNEDKQHIGMTIYYNDNEHNIAHYRLVSYENCNKESNYEVANKILKYIEDASYSQINKSSEISQKSIESIISYATQFFERNNNSLSDKNNIEPEKEM